MNKGSRLCKRLLCNQQLKLKDLQYYLWLSVLVLAFLGLSIKVSGRSILAYRLLLPVFIGLSLWNYPLLFKRYNQLKDAVFLRRYDQFLIFWFAWAVASLLWVRSYTAAFRNIYYLFLGILFIIFMQVFHGGERGKALYLNLFTVLSIAFFAFGYYELITGNHIPKSIFFNAERVDLRHRVTSFFINPNDFGAFASLFIWLFYIQTERLPKRWAKVCFAFIFSASSLILIVTTSRASILAFMMQVGILFLLNVGEIVMKLPGSIKRSIATLVFAFCFLYVNTLTNYGIYNGRILRLAETVKLAIESIFTKDGESEFSLRESQQQIIDMIEDFGVEKTSSNTRLNIIKNSLLMLKDSRFLGVGAGNFETYMEEYRETHYKVSKTNAHNWWMEVLVNYGLPVFLIYLALYLWLLWRLLVIYLKSAKEGDLFPKALSKGFLIMLIGFVLSSISPSSIMGMRTIWIAFGLIISFVFYYDVVKQNRVEA